MKTLSDKYSPDSNFWIMYLNVIDGSKVSSEAFETFASINTTETRKVKHQELIVLNIEELAHETEKAYLFEISQNTWKSGELPKTFKIWISKSRCEYDKQNKFITISYFIFNNLKIAPLHHTEPEYQRIHLKSLAEHERAIRNYENRDFEIEYDFSDPGEYGDEAYYGI